MGPEASIITRRKKLTLPSLSSYAMHVTVDE